MKLRLTKHSIKSIISPYSFELTDITSITPNINIGSFKGVGLNLIYGKIVIATENILLLYNKIEDFMAGFDPVSLVKDTSVKYDDQEPTVIDIKIVDGPNYTSNPDMQEIRELMFGARKPEDAEQDGPNDNSTVSQ